MSNGLVITYTHTVGLLLGSFVGTVSRHWTHPDRTDCTGARVIWRKKFSNLRDARDATLRELSWQQIEQNKRDAIGSSAVKSPKAVSAPAPIAA